MPVTDHLFLIGVLLILLGLVADADRWRFAVVYPLVAGLWTVILSGALLIVDVL